MLSLFSRRLVPIDVASQLDSRLPGLVSLFALQSIASFHDMIRLVDLVWQAPHYDGWI